MKKALLIIDVQKSAVVKPEIAKNIEKLQYGMMWFMFQNLQIQALHY